MGLPWREGKVRQLMRTRSFRRRLYGHLQGAPVDLSICVPYIGRIPGFRNIYHLAIYFAKQGGERFTVVTGPPGKEGGSLAPNMAEAISKLDVVDLRVRTSPFLHAKIYHLRFRDGRSVGYIGSANLTKGGLEGNDEVMGEMIEARETDAILSCFRQFTGPGSLPYHLWRLQSARRS